MSSITESVWFLIEKKFKLIFYSSFFFSNEYICFLIKLQVSFFFNQRKNSLLNSTEKKSSAWLQCTVQSNDEKFIVQFVTQKFDIMKCFRQIMILFVQRYNFQVELKSQPLFMKSDFYGYFRIRYEFPFSSD